MDIDLLAKMVKEVVMDHDNVTLPGVGSFVAELVPAAFADRGYTILPPYRRLFFSPKQGEDTLLADFYASSNQISQADAARILEEFLSEMKEVLKVRKTIVFPGLGRLRATRENHFFFVADEDLDIYPAGFGLQPISLKTHEETREEVAQAVASLAEILEVPKEEEQEMAGQAGHDEREASHDEAAPVPEPEPVVELEPVLEIEPVSEPEPVLEPEQEPEPEAEPETEPVSVLEPAPEPVIPGPDRESPAEEMAGQAGHDEAETGHDEEKTGHDGEACLEAPRRRRWWIWVLAGIVLLLVLAVAAWMLLGRLAPEWLDSFLYSAEELEILYS